MIKYYVEEYNGYYPSGGLDDIVGPFNTLEDAVVEYMKQYHHHDYTRIFRIVDSVIDHDWVWASDILP